jgi:rhodanese-related sulfurtransferase
MKKYLFITLVMLNFAACGDAQTKSDSKMTVDQKQTGMQYKVVGKQEFDRLVNEKKWQLVDVRTANEYHPGHIGNAINIDYLSADFKSKMAKVDKTKPLLIYCQSGNRSGKAAAILNEMGFKEVYDLQGGYGNY